MINKHFVFSVLMVASVVGCSSSTDQEPLNQSEQASSNSSRHGQVLAAEDTNHISQSLYLLQFERASGLHKQANQLALLAQQCTASDDDLIEQWQLTASHYMALQAQQKGPQLALDQSWKMQFWPDKKNTLGRQMQRLVSESPQISLESLQQQSVTVQGLGAFEWLLFDSAASTLKPEVRCHWQSVVAQNIAATTEIIAQSWTSNPWTSLDETQWLQESFSLVNNQLDFMLKKLALPLGTIGKPKPYFAEAWRSQLSYSNLYSNIIAIEQTLQVNNGLLDKLNEVDPKLHQLIVDSLKESIEQWPKDQQLFIELSTKEGYRNALSAYNRLEYLNYLVSEQAAQTLGVRVGFNATDGD